MLLVCTCTDGIIFSFILFTYGLLVALFYCPETNQSINAIHSTLRFGQSCMSLQHYFFDDSTRLILLKEDQIVYSTINCMTVVTCT